MLEQAISVPESITPMSFNFIGVKNFLVSSEGRPRIDISHGIERRFAQSRLEKTVINTMFGHMINPMITTRAYMNIEPIRLHLSLKSLRRGTVQITTEQEDPTGIWVEDSGIVSWNVQEKQAIVISLLSEPDINLICHLVFDSLFAEQLLRL